MTMTKKVKAKEPRQRKVVTIYDAELIRQVLDYAKASHRTFTSAAIDLIHKGLAQ